MSEDDLRLRVRCDKCGRNIGEVYELPDGSLRFRPIFPGQTDRSDTLTSGRFSCSDHGYASPAEVLKAVAASGQSVKTLRAHMGDGR